MQASSTRSHQRGCGTRAHLRIVKTQGRTDGLSWSNMVPLTCEGAQPACTPACEVISLLRTCEWVKVRTQSLRKAPANSKQLSNGQAYDRHKAC
eukprot:6204702-Pleurochrysis_carterae.AAC.2